MSNGRHTKAALYLLLVAYVSILAGYNVAAEFVSYADCPACFKNETPMAGHTDSQGGRPYYSVYADPNTVTNSKFTSALSGAMTSWNDARGTGKAH